MTAKAICCEDMGYDDWNGCRGKMGTTGRATSWAWVGAIRTRTAGTDEGGGGVAVGIISFIAVLLLPTCPGACIEKAHRLKPSLGLKPTVRGRDS